VLGAERKQLVVIGAAMVLMAACGPVCGPRAPAAAGWQLSMTGPVAGNLPSGTSTCQVFTASRRFDYLLGTKMSGKGLLLTLTV